MKAALLIRELEESAARMEAPPREIDAHPFPSSSASAATASSSSSLTESAIVQVMANRTCSASVSSLFASSRPQGWAELPDDLLRPVVALLRSFRDLLAFGTTCRHCGIKVGPPSLRSVQFTCISYVTLTAPVTSADSHLLVGAGAYLFLWHIGSNSWTKHSPKVGRFSIEQNVAFKGRTYALGSFRWFYIIHLSPSLIVQKFKVVFEEDKTEDLYSANEKAWLVVCGDALLLIKRVEAGRRMRSEAFQFMAFKLESLDAMTKKARWVKVNKLDNWAIFISVDERCEALPCMNPEGWGGRSNHIYFPSYLSEKPWAAVELWQKCYYRSTCSQLFNTGRRYLKLESTWVFPARFLVPDCEVDAVGD
ncbi:hypothetical protein TRIUR3_09369 [Triticum urartu]|uniref:KIB1-4 beta-propeller domain-containing protein n=1 Tax=Triticum urartu TaxID=4572 RepID=M7ZTX6_TRIUA|nr:hypothetical protein TRIUR3_09369 [Triticum urartu]